MRTEEEALHVCPVCQRTVSPGQLGLRDFRWVNKHLPERHGLTDIDGVYDQDRTGRMMAVEFKPNRIVPLGQKILFKNLRLRAIDVLVIVERPDKMGRYSYTWWDASATRQKWEFANSLDDLAAVVAKWEASS